ncbi:MAG: hypothetical protein EXR71_07630 [Myxococcales bacterium]|nr:hypothetical protein [Myxococcales bacterium]
MNGDSPSRFRSWCDAQPAASGVHGVAALVEGVVAAVPKRAWLFPGRRERGAAILRGADPERIAAARPYKVVPPGESPSVRALTAVGVALSGEPAVCFLGTGSVSYGNVTEALNLAALHQAPVLFVVAWYGDEGPFAPQLAVSPAVLAAALGLATATCDGADVESVRGAVKKVGAGPALVVATMPHG